MALGWEAGVKCGPCPQAGYGLVGEAGLEVEATPLGLGLGWKEAESPGWLFRRCPAGSSEGGGEHSRQGPQPVQRPEVRNGHSTCLDATWGKAALQELRSQQGGNGKCSCPMQLMC